MNEFPQELWTDFNDTQIGTYLLRTEAYIGDLLGYQLNASVMETLLLKVVRERNMRLIAQGFGYKMKSASGATTTLRIYDLPTPPHVAYPFTISKHHQFTVNGEVFQPLANKTVTSVSVLNNVDDGYYTDIDVKQGEEIFEEFLGTSNGLPAQRYTLGSFPVQDGTIEITVTADGGYTLVDSFTLSSTTSTHYRIYADESGTVTVEFGDGVLGKIPTSGQVIRATYRVGGSVNGNMPANVLTWGASGSSDGGSPLPSVVQAASIRNTTAAVGGGPKETVEQARRNIPGFNRTNDRAITATDYGDLSRLVAGVAHAKSFAGRPVLGTRPIYVFLVPQGGGPPSAPLIDSVAAYLAVRKEAGRPVVIQGARYVGMSIAIEAYLQDTARRNTVGGYLQTAVTLAFNPNLLEFDSVFPLQALYDTIDPENIPGLKRAFIREFRSTAGWDKYPSLPPIGSGVVTYIKAGTTAVTREWNVRFINPTPPLTCPEYQVYERVNATTTAVSSTSVSDSGSYFPAGSYVGWSLVPIPEDGLSTTFVVTANTDRTLEVDPPGLTSFLGVGDPFAVEKLVSRGKALVSTVTAASVGTILTVTSTANWEVGDEVLVLAVGEFPLRASVSTILSGTQLRLSTTAPVSIGDTVNYVWKDPSDRLEFAVNVGSSPWTVGDQFYVDTYSEVADVKLRGGEFPYLDPGDLKITMIGGIQ